MNVAPDCVFITVLSLISLRNWTCGAISEPNAAVAIRQPPPSLLFPCAGCDVCPYPTLIVKYVISNGIGWNKIPSISTLISVSYTHLTLPTKA